MAHCITPAGAIAQAQILPPQRHGERSADAHVLRPQSIDYAAQGGTTLPAVTRRFAFTCVPTREGTAIVRIDTTSVLPGHVPHPVHWMCRIPSSHSPDDTAGQPCRRSSYCHHRPNLAAMREPRSSRETSVANRRPRCRLRGSAVEFAALADPDPPTPLRLDVAM